MISGKNKPPFLAMWIFDLVADDGTRYSLMGDIAEAYCQMRIETGRIRAAIWFWFMLFRSLPILLFEKLSWSMVMLKSYIKISVRNLMRHKSYSFINITGLSIGMACAIIIMLWVQEELSYDDFHANGNNIYRIVGDWEKYQWDGFEGSPMPLGALAESELPEVKAFTRFASHNQRVFRYKDRAFYENTGLIADPSLFSVFSFPFVKGDPETAFSHPATVVLTEETAFKYFGDEDPVGKVLLVDTEEWTVTGVVRNIPENSHIQFDYVNSLEFLGKYAGWGTGWNSYNFVQFLLVDEDADPDFVGEKLTEIALNNDSPQVKGGVTFRLQPLNEVHLDARNYDRGWTELGDSRHVYMFSLVAVLVLLIACVNFMNLSTARAGQRAKEVGLRKTVGAVRSQLINQFFGESIILSLFSFVLALIIAAAVIPLFNTMTDSRIALNLLEIDILFMLLGIAFLTEIVSGFYPALYLSRFKPVSVLRPGSNKGNKKSRFRTLLVISQFTIAVTLIIANIFIFRQLNYAMDIDLGFEKENVIYLPVKENIGPEFSQIKERLLSNPDILSVSSARYVFGATSNRMTGFDWEGKDPDHSVDMILGGVEFGFFETIQLPIVKGRYFSEEFPTDREKGIILNEKAVEEMKVINPVGLKMDVYNMGEGVVVGVVKDAHLRSLHYEIEPRFFYMDNLENISANASVVIRLSGSNILSTMKYIEDVWNSVNTISPFDYSFLDQEYELLYRKEKQTGQIFNASTILVIIISCLGLFGLSSFVIEQRTKEIGIRKALGGSVFSIIFMLSREFLLWIIISNLIAWPIAYFVVEKMLESFSYRIPIHADVFAISAVIALSIAVLTIGRQSVKAARSNPVESLRYE